MSKTASYNPRTNSFTLFENGKITGQCSEMTYNQHNNTFQQRNEKGSIIACYKSNNS